jgi:hypothetical protein
MLTNAINYLLLGKVYIFINPVNLIRWNGIQLIVYMFIYRIADSTKGDKHLAYEISLVYL